MLVEELAQRFKELLGRMERHGDLLRQSVIQTRYTLIDPLLRALGWDTEDPAQVCLDWRPGLTTKEVYPYALLYKSEVRLTLIVKALDSDLTDAQHQLDKLWQETPYLAMTDGNRWEVYASHPLVVPEKKLVLEFQISRVSADASHQASFLQPSVLGPCGPPVPVIPLLEAVEAAECIEDGKVFLPSPLYLPKESVGPLTKWAEVPFESWKDICVKVVQHLVSSGKLTPSHCPIQRSQASRYIVHKEPFHSTGAPFDQPTQVGQIWVDTKYDRDHLVSNAEIILRHVGEDPRRYGCQLSGRTHVRSEIRQRLR